jgi:hypothetical protein
MKSSLETMANTDRFGNSSVLPSILPAVNSTKSDKFVDNDLMDSLQDASITLNYASLKQTSRNRPGITMAQK